MIQPDKDNPLAPRLGGNLAKPPHSGNEPGLGGDLALLQAISALSSEDHNVEEKLLIY